MVIVLVVVVVFFVTVSAPPLPLGACCVGVGCGVGFRAAAAFRGSGGCSGGVARLATPAYVGGCDSDPVAQGGPSEVAKLYADCTRLRHTGPGHRPLPANKAENAAAVAAQLDEKLPTIRQAALAALGKLDSAKLAAHADAVARMLADGEFGVREAAVRALARLKPAHLTPHLVDALAACLDDKDEVVRDAAHEALAVLPPASLGAHAGRLSRDQAKNHARIALGVCAPFVVLLLIAHIVGIVDLRDPVNELPKLVGIGAATDADGNYL